MVVIYVQSNQNVCFRLFILNIITLAHTCAAHEKSEPYSFGIVFRVRWFITAVSRTRTTLRYDYITNAGPDVVVYSSKHYTWYTHDTTLLKSVRARAFSRLHTYGRVRNSGVCPTGEQLYNITYTSSTQADLLCM